MTNLVVHFDVFGLISPIPSDGSVGMGGGF